MKALCTKKCNNWWMRRHLETKSLAALVSTRNSGASFRNSKALDGCLALEHANTFIPSTLNGSCVQNGKVNEEILKKSLDSAIDVYIGHVDKCPCAGTVINLFKGACNTDLQHEQVAVKTFLSGTRKEKELLTSEDSELCAKLNSALELLKMHMMSSLPSQYLFYLRCCYQPDCIHPVCRAEKPQERLWYSDSPPLSFLPLPTPDPANPYGNMCQECERFCMGHYLSPTSWKSWQRIVMLFLVTNPHPR